MSTEATLSRSQILEMAHHITPYRGDGNPRCIQQYIYAALDRFDGHPENERLLIEMLLKGQAKTWVRECQEKPEWLQLSGQEVLDLLKATFYPADYAETAIRNITLLKRGSNSLAAFLKEFTQLSREIPAGAFSDDALCVFLAYGCGEPFATDLRRCGLTTFQELFDYLQRQADTSEFLSEYNISSSNEGTKYHASTIGQVVVSKKGSAVAVKDIATMTEAEIKAINERAKASLICHYCRKQGHLKRNCRLRITESRRNRKAQSQGDKK